MHTMSMAESAYHLPTLTRPAHAYMQPRMSTAVEAYLYDQSRLFGEFSCCIDSDDEDFEQGVVLPGEAKRQSCADTDGNSSYYACGDPGSCMKYHNTRSRNNASCRATREVPLTYKMCFSNNDARNRIISAKMFVEEPVFIHDMNHFCGDDGDNDSSSSGGNSTGDSSTTTTTTTTTDTCISRSDAGSSALLSAHRHNRVEKLSAKTQKQQHGNACDENSCNDGGCDDLLQDRSTSTSDDDEDSDQDMRKKTFGSNKMETEQDRSMDWNAHNSKKRGCVNVRGKKRCFTVSKGHGQLTRNKFKPHVRTMLDEAMLDKLIHPQDWLRANALPNHKYTPKQIVLMQRTGLSELQMRHYMHNNARKAKRLFAIMQERGEIPVAPVMPRKLTDVKERRGNRKQ